MEGNTLKTYCIFLEERRDNVEKNIIPHCPNVELVEAIDANSNIFKVHMEGRSVDKDFLKFCNKGQLACFLSHIKVWKKMIDENIERAIVLEDDAKIEDDFNTKVKEIILEIPDSKFIYLFVHPDSKISNGESASESLAEGYPTFGTVGYYITLDLIKEFLRVTEDFKEISGPVDHFISLYLQNNNIRYYCTKDNIVETLGNFYHGKEENILGSLIGKTSLYKYDKMEEGITMLNMIVKNEEKIITRCLDSLEPYIDGVIICDTGSTDGTVDVIEEWMKNNDKIGYVFSAGWVNFEYNRNLALEKCKEWMNDNLDTVSENGNIFLHKICFMDADDIISIKDKNENKFRELLSDVKGEVWYLNMDYAGVTYSRLFMVKYDIESKWKGVLHEYLECSGNYINIDCASIVVNRDGDRNKDPVKYLRDALVLEKALLEDPDNSRNMFYLAQSYKDYGYYRKAEEIYLDRFEMEGHDEERYISLLEAAKCRSYRKDCSNDKKYVDLLIKAMGFRPHRLEAPYYLLKHYRTNEQYYMGYILGRHYLLGNSEILGKDTLFVEVDVYKWKFFDELSICAYWSRDRELAKALVSKVLEHSLSEKDRERIESNSTYF